MRLSIFLSVILLCVNSIPMDAQDTLTVNQAVAEALQKNFDITLAQNNLQIAKVNNTIGNAGMLPKVDLNSTRTLAVNNTHQIYESDGKVVDNNNAKTNNFNAGLQLNWTFFDGLNMFIQKTKLDQIQNLNELQLQSATENIVSQVIRAYYDYVVQQKLADVYKDALRLSRERRDVSKARFNLGSGSELILLQATVDMNADSATYLRQLQVVRNSQATINQLLCRDLNTPFITSKNIPLIGKFEYNTLWTEIEQQSPEILIARKQVELASLSIKELQTYQLPRLSLNSGYSYGNSTSDVSIYSTNRNYGWNVGVTLSYNLFNGFTNREKISTARIREQSAKITEQSVRLDIEANLKQVYNDYTTSRTLVIFETENVAFARHNLDVAREKYRLGAYSDIEMRETQVKLVDAENRLLLAQFRSKAAETELLRISGNLSKEVKE